VIDVDGNPCPVIVKLSPDAKAIWATFYNRHAQEQVDLQGELSAAWSKLEEYAARLALVIHFVRWAADDPNLQDPDVVDARSMEAGVKLVQWFKHEARRVYAMLSETEESREQRRLLEWVESRGGSVTARQVQQGHRQYRTAQDAHTALDALVKEGHGYWQDVPTTAKGGRPSRVFHLSTVSTVYETSLNPDENTGSVDVDSVDARGTGSDDEEWGEV
jgi:hypothetical protein